MQEIEGNPFKDPAIEDDHILWSVQFHHHKMCDKCKTGYLAQQRVHCKAKAKGQNRSENCDSLSYVVGYISIFSDQFHHTFTDLLRYYDTQGIVRLDCYTIYFSHKETSIPDFDKQLVGFTFSARDLRWFIEFDLQFQRFFCKTERTPS